MSDRRSLLDNEQHGYDATDSSGEYTKSTSSGWLTRNRAVVVIAVVVAVLVIAGIGYSIYSYEDGGGDNPSNTPWSAPRLPTTVVPLWYNISQSIFPDKYLFGGTVDVAVNVAAPTENIWMHAADLNVTVTSLVDATGAVRTPTNVFLYAANEYIVMQFASAVPAGSALITMTFNGILNDSLAGLYISTYTDTANVNHILAVTQFEATDARRAFPCFDEPAFKAVFAMNITAPNDQNVLFNTDEATPIDLGNGLTTHVFYPTPIMSSYLVAYTVNQFNHTEVNMAATPNQPALLFRTWSTPDKINATIFPNTIGANVTFAFANYFLQPLPLTKQDEIAVPDFAAGAMENVCYQDKYNAIMTANTLCVCVCDD